MKITKKITSVVLALLLAVSAFAGLAITAGAAAPTTATLTIHKYDLDETKANASEIGNTNSLTGTTADEPTYLTKMVEGAEFTLYYQGPLGTATPTTPDVSDTAKVKAVTTDANGTATFSTTENDKKTGLYYVVETSAPEKVTKKATSFYVSLPMTTQNTSTADNNGVTWNADVHVYPKNLTTLGGAKLTKTINTAAPTKALAQAPQFKLTDADKNVIAENISADFGYATFTINAALSEELKAKYSTVSIAQKNGVIAVDGLPVGTYSFEETRAAIINEGEDELPMDTAKRTFSVTKGNNVDVVTANEETFGNLSKVNFADTSTYTFEIDNSTEPTIAKEVDKENASYGEDVTWTITPVVPADIATYRVYKVTDTIDSRLDIAGASAVTVKLDGVVYTDAAVDVTGRNVTVDFAGHFADLVGKELTIEIVTQINNTAVAYEKIKNKATLTYQNSYDKEQTKDSKEPETYTGEFDIVKVDKADHETKLANVEFTLKNGENAEIKVKKDATGYYVSDDSDATSTVVTDANGKIVVRGLKPGAYTLTETKTNNGYQLLTAPVDITVEAGTKGEVLTIENVKQPDLPLTGGMGTILFTVAGLALIGGAAIFFIRSRKSKKEEA